MVSSLNITETQQKSESRIVIHTRSHSQVTFSYITVFSTITEKVHNHLAKTKSAARLAQKFNNALVIFSV